MENFAREVKVPVLLSTNAKKILYISSFLGSRGLEVYNELFDNSSKTKNLENNIKIWKTTKIDKQLNDELTHYHSKVNVSAEEWSELIKLIPTSSDIRIEFESEKVLKEIIPLLKNQETKSVASLSIIYFLLFQPNFETLIEKTLTTEKNNVKRDIIKIRERGEYSKLKPQKKLLEQIFTAIISKK